MTADSMTYRSIQLASLLLMLTGCTTTEEAVTLRQALMIDDDFAGGAMTGQSDGLELRKWLVTDDPTRIAGAMTRYRAGDTLDARGHLEIVGRVIDRPDELSGVEQEAAG